MEKLLALLCALLLTSPFASADTTPEYQLSTHILDIAKGAPAANVEIELFKYSEKKGLPVWTSLKKAKTDNNGRIGTFLEKKDGAGNVGTYKLVFYTQPYFEHAGRQSFYPYVEVVFHIKDSSHYHVPITLSDFGYSTYRGS